MISTGSILRNQVHAGHRLAHAWFNHNSKKKVGITIKEKKQVVTRNTYALSCIGYCYNSKPNACTNKTFSSISTRFNLYFGWCVLHTYFIPAKVDIKSCRCARECFIKPGMHWTQASGCLVS